MRIATWNINGIRARLDFLRAWLHERKPDLVGLQELKVADEGFPHGDIEAEGYRALVHGQKAWNGVAVLFRGEAEVAQSGLPGQEDLGARLLTARIGGLSFTTVYVPNGKSTDHPDYPRKLAWLDALADHLESTGAKGTAAVVCGDFNVCPTALDTWNEDGLRGTIFHTDEERGRFRALTERGFRDVFRQRRPDAREYSWWDYRAGAFPRGLGLRIDFLLATEPVLARVTSVEIDREWRKKKGDLKPSDHAPVVADLT